MSGTSRMRRESHVRICERLGVRLPGPTRQLIGPYKNNGSDYRPEGCPDQVKVHDFVDAELGKVVP
jgi:Rhodopirellula transposase DDE domain